MVFLAGYPRIMVAIPFKELIPTVKECIQICQNLDYPNYKIILLPDFPLNQKFKNCEEIATGPIHQADKRNIAIQQTKGEIFASIDSDAYPHRDWLKNALAYFKDTQIGAVTGPNMAVPRVSLRELAAVRIAHSEIAGMNAAYYLKGYSQNGIFEFKEAPSSNLIIRKEALLKIGGYESGLATGEDSKLGFALRKAGYKIVYTPEVIVYHHRRPLYIPHLKRVFQHGRDKAKILKTNFSNDKLIYFIPSMFFIGVTAGFGISTVNPRWAIPYILVLAVYSVFVGYESYSNNNLKLTFLVFSGMFLTHLSYGLGFILGFFGKKK